REIKDHASLLDRLERELREAENQAMSSGHLLRQLDAELARVSERARTCELEIQRLGSERAGQEELITARQTELAGVSQQQLELEQLVAAAQVHLGELRERRDNAANNASQHRAEVATLEERHRSAAATLQRFESLVSEMRERLILLRTQMEAAFAELLQRAHENQVLAQQLVNFEEERNASETRDALLQSEMEQVRARITEINEALHSARELLDRARDRREEYTAVLAKLQSDLQHMADTCLTELGLPREELVADSTIEIVNGEQLVIEDQAYRDMRARLDAMGPVNMMALEEYKETAERHGFLETQRKDLFDSIENTQATIKEIDVFSKQKFEEAFHKINENFQTTFKKLFGGGHAFMRLTDEENSAESGIDVVASPPGKKLQNVLLLSGGEKALTALALLVGIFQYQPSPFCILDEVDAPLDEANVGRFTELVKEMSVQTQFVLITHSKKTMGIAPVLYGVTMQEPGVSKLVSVKFGETA
ncbi:MAG TPA: chromosome segregation protein SMC, partial [Candidatus Angelobacter sp.]